MPDLRENIAGRWSSGKGYTHLIGVDTIQWSTGEISRYTLEDRMPWLRGQATCKIHLNGKILRAKFTADGKLEWSDGDIWTRILNKDVSTPAYQVGEAGFRAIIGQQAVGEEPIKLSKEIDNVPKQRTCQIGSFMGVLLGTADPMERVKPDALPEVQSGASEDSTDDEIGTTTADVRRPAPKRKSRAHQACQGVANSLVDDC
jgi:hypothetical protein